MQMNRSKAVDELERVVQCREVARCNWRYHKSRTEKQDQLRIKQLAEFNETIFALKNAIKTNDADLIVKALELSKRTP